MRQSQVTQLMRKHMDNNGLQDWKIGFKRSKNILATCYYDKKEIRIAKWYYEMNDCKAITRTILHEIAHALLGWGFGHSIAWVHKCRQIGLKNPSQYADREKHNSPAPKYAGSCGTHNFRAERKRKRNGICSLCRTKIEWTDSNGRKVDFDLTGGFIPASQRYKFI